MYHIEPELDAPRSSEEGVRPDGRRTMLAHDVSDLTARLFGRSRHNAVEPDDADASEER